MISSPRPAAWVAARRLYLRRGAHFADEKFRHEAAARLEEQGEAAGVLAGELDGKGDLAVGAGQAGARQGARLHAQDGEERGGLGAGADVQRPGQGGQVDDREGREGGARVRQGAVQLRARGRVAHVDGAGGEGVEQGALAGAVGQLVGQGETAFTGNLLGRWTRRLSDTAHLTLQTYYQHSLSDAALGRLVEAAAAEGCWYRLAPQALGYAVQIEQQSGRTNRQVGVRAVEIMLVLSFR